MPVCQITLLNVLNIKICRVQRILDNIIKSSTAPAENRERDNKSTNYKDKSFAVITFIKTSKCDTSHYCRSSSARQYLISELSMNRLFRMYNN